MRRRRALTVTITTILIALLIAAPLAHASTLQDLKDAERRAEELRDAAAAAESAANALGKEIIKLDASIEEGEAAVRSLADEVAEATERSLRLQGEVDVLRLRIEAKEAEIEATQAELERQQALLADRVESTYKQSDFFFLEMLLGSANIEDLINRTSLVTRVIRQNQLQAFDLKETRIALDKAKAELDRDLETLSTKRAEAAAEEKRLRELRTSYQARVDQQEAAANAKAALMAENKANAATLRDLAEEEEAESARIAKELYGSGSGYYAGIMSWPVPTFFRIASPFGYRIHPILGYRKMHTGIDIGRDLNPPRSIDGATIIAAGDGTVIYVGYRSGYGNTVMVDHGDGVVTLYAHMQNSSFKVGNGQRVSEGQALGKVGATGLSTGPHLHFETRVNGTPVDPMKYLD